MKSRSFTILLCLTLAASASAVPTFSLTKVSDASEACRLPGEIKIGTSPKLTAAVTVRYEMSGTAKSGEHFEALSGEVTFAKGSYGGRIQILPRWVAPDADTEVTFTLLESESYAISETAGECTVTIANLPPIDAGDTRTIWIANDDGNASDPANWSTGRIPTEDEDIYVLGKYSQAQMTWDAGTDGLPDRVKTWTQDADFAGRIDIPTVRPGYGSFTGFVVTGNAELNGGEWWRAGQIKDDGNKVRVWLNVVVKGDLFVGEGFTFNAVNGGYGKARGESAGWEKNRGASHGGFGASTNDYALGKVYGDLKNPTSLGSGTYAGTICNGGGAIVLNVSGDCVFNGNANAYATGANSCGAAGGSINITASTFSGSGSVLASGGSTSNNRHGGGGGRIAISLGKEGLSYDDFLSSFVGSVSACGGITSKTDSGRAPPGAAGTVYIETPEDDGIGRLWIHNKHWTQGNPVHDAVTPVPSNEVWEVSSVSLADNARFAICGTLRVPSFDKIVYDTTTATDYSLLLLWGGNLESGIKSDKLVANGYDVAVEGTNTLARHTLEIPEGFGLSVNTNSHLTVGSLKLNGVRVPAGDYTAAELAAAYPDLVSGDETGTVTVTGAGSGLQVIVR